MNPQYNLQHKKIWVAGHTGMVGAALVRCLQSYQCQVLTAPRTALDLRRQQDVERWMAAERPDAVIIAAATVGGIGANSTRPAEFLYDNLMIESHIIEAARHCGVKKLLFLGSSCIYPRAAPQPIREEALLTGPLEPTNEAYALAKIAGVKLCQSYRAQYGCDFISAMPCNLYGPGDRYDAQHSHVIPALMMKMDKAARSRQENVTLWGTGMPLREFLYVDDLAAALVHMLQHYSSAEPVNIGSGQEISIAALARMIAHVTGYQGRIDFDDSHPDGTPRKVIDSGLIRSLGWQPAVSLEDGLRRAYQDYCARLADSRRHEAAL